MSTLFLAIRSALVLAVVTVTIWYWLKNRRRYELLNKLPCKRRLPIIGNVLDILLYGDIYQYFTDVCNIKDGICRVNIMVDDFVMLTNAENLKTFYTSRNTDRSDIYQPLSELVYDSVFVSGGSVWRGRRKLLLGNFFNIPPQQLFDNFKLFYGAFIQDLTKKADGNFFPVLEDLQLTACRAVFELAMGGDLPKEMFGITNKIAPFMKAWFLHATSPFHYFDPVFRLTPTGRQFYNIVKTMRGIFESYTKDKMADFQDPKQRDSVNTSKLFYVMLEKHPELSYIEVASEALTLLPASVDTTTTTTSFILLILGLFPEVQEKVYQEDLEVREMLDGGEPTADDMRHYKYFDLVVKETLRLFPIAPIIGRKLSEDTYFGKYLIPAQTNVIAYQGFANHAEEYFKDPLKFDPDRFLPENAANIPPYAYNPFSSGPRSCPGQKYALLAMNVVILGIVRKFKIYDKYKNLDELLNNVSRDVTIKDKDNFQIRLEHRK